MNLKKIKDNKKKVRDGKLKNLALAGMMGLAGITGMNSCGDDPLEEEDHKPKQEQITGDPKDNQGGENNQNGENIQGDNTPAPAPEDTTDIKSAPRYLEKGTYNGYDIRPRSVDIKVTCPTDKKAFDLKTHLPLLEVKFVPENSNGNVVCLVPGDKTEQKWDDILKLMK